MADDPRIAWWQSDVAIDGGLVAIGAVPWAFPGPPMAVRLLAVGICVGTGVVGRYVTRNFELPAAITILSVLVRLAWAVMS